MSRGWRERPIKPATGLAKDKFLGIGIPPGRNCIKNITYKILRRCNFLVSRYQNKSFGCGKISAFGYKSCRIDWS